MKQSALKLYIYKKPEKMLILKRFKFEQELTVFFFTKYIEKYMNMIINWIQNDFNKV